MIGKYGQFQVEEMDDIRRLIGTIVLFQVVL